MNKIYVGIDISKEKCNLCYRRGLEIVREEECLNEIKALKKAIKAALKAVEAMEENQSKAAIYILEMRYHTLDLQRCSLRLGLYDKNSKFMPIKKV